MRNFCLLLLVLLTTISCKKEFKSNVNVSNIFIDSKIARFEIDFYNASENTLADLKEKYPMMFPHNIDSVWVNKIQNKDEQELFAETQKLYKDFYEIEAQLEDLFKHVKYYNPNFKVPTVITSLSNLDYYNRILYTGDFLVISLDLYLGANHEFYNDYPAYIKANNTKDHIIVDVANSIIEKQVNSNSSRAFVLKLIAEGKKMYLLDLYLPNISDDEKIGYIKEKYNWVLKNEEQVWRYFIDKDLLYSTDSKLNKRFIDVAPFSKFYLEEDPKTPGRVGVYIGWQIVRAFMQNNDVSLHELMQTDAEVVFNKSKYKPKR